MINTAYALTGFETLIGIPDSKSAKHNDLAECPHCGFRDEDTYGFAESYRCKSCGMLYFIVRRKDGIS